MRIINYDETDRIADCSMQRGSRVYDVQIVNIEYCTVYDAITEESDIDLTEFTATEYDNESDTFIPLTLTNDEIYQFKRGLLEYIDFEDESEMFDSGDREGSCW